MESAQKTRATIWRYDVVHGGIITMPAGARILKVARLSGELLLWALVDPEVPKVKRRIHIVPTGGDVSESWEHAGTVPAGRSDVFHVFLEIV